MGFDVPVLFLVFNRPELTQKVFEAIRIQRPRRLYIAADGPRNDRNGEWQLCAQTREIVNHVDWECDLKTLFQDHNLGCGKAVSSAISWFFEHEEEGIILEDDTLPSPSFFTFCAEMLSRFRENPSVGTISGNWFLPRALHHPKPYIFSRYAQIWGWATWRRTWALYDLSLSGTEEQWETIIRRHHPVDLEAKFWLQVYRNLVSGMIDTWDFQVLFTAWKHDLVHIAPTRNLVRNLGYGPGATHTIYESPLANLASEEITGYETTLPVDMDPELDQAIFFFRFLDALNTSWTLHEAIDISEKLGWARSEAEHAKKELQLLRKLTHDQSAAIERMIQSRASNLYRFRLGIFLAQSLVKAVSTLEVVRQAFRRFRQLSRRSSDGMPETLSDKTDKAGEPLKRE